MARGRALLHSLSFRLIYSILGYYFGLETAGSIYMKQRPVPLATNYWT